MCYNKFPMIKSALLGLLFLLIATPAYAESKVNVNVNTDVDSTSNSKIDSQTDITVETNGKKTNYTSDQPGNIEVKAENDNHTVKVNGEVIQVGGSTQNPNTSGTPTPTINEDKNNNNINDNLEKSIEFVDEEKSLIEALQDLVKKVFSVFG